MNKNKAELTDKVAGYHYTNSEAYQSMQTKGVDGCFSDYDDFTGLVPSRRFISLGKGNGLPDEAHDGVIEGLLESEPNSWLKNEEFPHFWRYLMGDVCRRKEIILLSFELNPEDKAYVVDRAHVERGLYSETKPTKESMNEPFRKYWESRVSVSEYDRSYSAPQLAIWSPIEFDRLKVEWIKPHNEVWQRVLDNGW